MGARTIWAAVSESELAAIGSAGWRSWPALVPLRAMHSRDEAVAAAKGFAREHGAGSAVRLEVDGDLGERTAIDVTALKKTLTVAIIVDAEYRAAVTDLEVHGAEAVMALRLPMGWRRHVQSPAWFRRGWMRTGAFVSLYTPSETAESIGTWGEAAAARAGMIVIGGDGGGEMLTLDARDPSTTVTLTPMVGIGWEDSVVQAASVERFIQAIEDGSFEFVFGRS